LPDLQRMKPGRGSVCGPVGASEFLVRPYDPFAGLITYTF
jgi:hypothetical protein